MTVDRNGGTRWKNQNGDLHRLDGPAFVSRSGKFYVWAYCGHVYPDFHEFCKGLNLSEEEIFLLRLKNPGEAGASPYNSID
jgi:hypothetical protein